MTTRGRPAVVVRRLLADDAPAVGRLREALYAQHARLRPDFFEVAAEGQSFHLERLAAGGKGVALVAQVAGLLVGVLLGQVHSTPAERGLRRRRRLHIEELAVSSGARRRGVGRALYLAAEAHAVALGAEQVVLTVWAGNPAGDAFYRSLAFAEAGTLYVRELVAPKAGRLSAIVKELDVPAAAARRRRATPPAAAKARARRATRR